MTNLDIKSASTLDPAVLLVGAERTPVIHIDAIFDNLPDVVARVLAGAEFGQEEHTYYPGIRAPLDADYGEALLRVATEPLREIYQIPSVLQAQVHAAFYSYVARPQNRLSPLQCMPHFDTTNNHQFALMHFMNPGPFGGTGFYRHNPTGYENVTAAEQADYMAARDRFLKLHGMPKRRYFRDSDEHFNKIGSIDYRQNRLLIYPGSLLHSGLIEPDRDIRNTPREARLTANVFLTFA